ncbi:MAG TPA: (d)CMP kinase [Actinobacteria bacterium]|nr:(d)CMP kinase [Actinomycetota bacterium]
MTSKTLALDGPAGSGKSSVGRAVAQSLGWVMLDTGAMYRAVTWAVLEARIDLTDPVAISLEAANTTIRITTDPRNFSISANGHEITSAIRSPEVTAAVSAVSAVPDVRELLVKLQREAVAASDFGIVIEGRDIGTVVLPDSALMVFLTASPEARARRRSLEVDPNADAENIADTRLAIMARDAKDSEREHSPLKPATDSQILDTSELTLDQVVDQLVQMAHHAYP